MKKSRIWLLGVISLFIITAYGCSASTNTTENKAGDGEVKPIKRKYTEEERKEILLQYPYISNDQTVSVALQAVEDRTLIGNPTKEEQMEILKEYPDECFDQATAEEDK